MAEMNVPESGAKKGKKKARSKKMSTRVDLTAMVDLGFLLITFFMLATTFNKPKTMEVNKPAKDDDMKDQPAIKSMDLAIPLKPAPTAVQLQKDPFGSPTQLLLN